MKSKIMPKKIPIKFIPSMKASSHAGTISFSRPPTYSLSKIRDSRIFNSSLELQNTTSVPKLPKQDTPQSKLYKQNTQSTDSFSMSERPKEIISLEKKLNSISPFLGPKEKYLEFNTIWGEANNLIPVSFKILTQIKNGVGEYVKYLEDYVESLMKDQKDFQESVQTLKILKKRFQKLALENLEVNNLLVEKDNDYVRMKEKFKSAAKEFRLGIADKEEIINNLSSELKEVRMQVFLSISKIEKYKKSTGFLLKIYEEIKESGKIDSEIYQKLVRMNAHLNENEMVRVHTNSSIEFDKILEGPFVATHSKDLSFFSASEMDSLINFNLM